MCQVLKQSVHIAKKKHPCMAAQQILSDGGRMYCTSICDGFISPGQYYENASIVDYGDFWQWKAHGYCNKEYFRQGYGDDC